MLPDTPTPETLPVYCAHCGGAVTLQMSSWPNTRTHALPHWSDADRADWRCPYCFKENTGGFPGRLAWVTKGHREAGIA